MNAQRLCILGMILLAAASLSLMSGTYGFAAAVAVAAAWATFTNRRWQLKSERRLLVFVLLALAFALKHRVIPYQPPIRSDLFFYVFSLAYAAGQYAVVSMVLSLVLAGPVPRLAGLLGALAVMCAGNFLPSPSEQWVYRALAGAYVVLMCLFFVTRQETPDPARRRRGAAAGIIMSVAVGIGLLLSVLTAQAMERYGTDAMNLFLKYHPWNRRSFNPGGGNESPTLDSVSAMRLGPRAENIALRVYSDTLPGYLREAAWENYTDGRWFASLPGEVIEPVEALPEGLEPRAGETFRIRTGGGPWKRMEIWRDPESDLGMFTRLDTVYVAAPVDSVRRSVHGTVRSTDLHGGVNVETFAGRVVPREEASAVLAASLRVPEHLRDQLAVLAEQLMGDLSTTPEKVRAVEAYFHENYRYKLGIQVPPDQDPIAWFLRARPPAHCEFFAAAATLVLRAGGVPSRYVTGFVARERNEAGGYWVARNRDAHAWTEAYDRASRTWVTVEATPADGVPQPQQTPWLAGLLDRFEQGLLSLRTAHFRGGFIGVVAWLGRAGWRLLVALVTRWWGWPILAVAAWWLGRKLWRRIRPWLARPRRSPPDPVVQAMRKLLARVDRKLARRGLARADGETLHQFARRIRPIDPAASDWYLAYARRRYSGQLRADDLQTLRGDQTGW